jgi:small nuclear ribonucleoprotein (snRNP)-like protein
MQQNIRVKFQGGREVTGILKGFDKLLNLVLDETIEYMRGNQCTFEFINLVDFFELTKKNPF